MVRGKLLMWAVTSALAGFLFGFDTVVISGAEKQIQDLWSLSGTMHGWALSSALWGTVLGALCGGWPTQHWGRKKTLIFNGVLYVISAIGSAYAWDFWSFSIARFLGGVGIGISTIAAPLFIAEISPAGNRGRLAALFQFNIVFGILAAYVSNFLIGDLCSAETAWRWMLGAETFPAILYTALCFSLPESPRWLIVEAGRQQEGIAVFRRINPDMSEAEIQKLAASVEASADIVVEKKSKFWAKRLRYPILFAFLIAFFNQMSGINVILYFAPRLLGLAGLNNALAASISLGVTNLIFTFVGLWLIDRIGRRALLLIGSVGYIVSLGVCAIAFFSCGEFKTVSASLDAAGAADRMIRIGQKVGYITEADRAQSAGEYTAARANLDTVLASPSYQGSVTLSAAADPVAVKDAATRVNLEASQRLGSVSTVVLLCMIVFIAAHAIGSGTIIWVFIAEIFPNDQRAAGQALGSFTHWIFAALLTLVFPIAIKAFDAGYMFAFFCAMMILQMIWAITMMPETKGRPLEEIERELSPDRAGADSRS